MSERGIRGLILGGRRTLSNRRVNKVLLQKRVPARRASHLQPVGDARSVLCLSLRSGVPPHRRAFALRGQRLASRGPLLSNIHFNAVRTAAAKERGASWPIFTQQLSSTRARNWRTGSKSGAYSIIKGKVTIGQNTIVQEHSHVHGSTVIGAGCKIGAGSVCGARPAASSIYG